MFTCDRTCPLFETLDRCRFNGALRDVTRIEVNSHTARIKVSFDNLDQSRAAVEHLGGTWLGVGKHRLYEGSISGAGFRLPNWHYPIVCSEGQLAYDDFRGSWGNVADLDKLKAQYALQAALAGAQSQGWATQLSGDTLVIHHPSGGTLTVQAGSVDASGFVGQGCHEALLALNCPLSDLVAKPEYGQVAAEVRRTQ